MNIRRLADGVAASLLFAFAIPAGAGDAILAVTGKLTGGEMTLTLAEVEALGAARMVPTTLWHDGRVTFEGVLMARFLEAVGARSRMAYVRLADSQLRDRMTAGSDIAS